MALRDISLACNDMSLSGAKQTLAFGLQGEFMSSRPLVLRVAKGPSQPRMISEQQRREIWDRVAMGEPRAVVAKAYDVDIDYVKALR